MAKSVVIAQEQVLVPADRALQHRIYAARRRRTALSAVLGPGFVAAVAYIDPGNFATNISAGATFGYALLWVIVVANLMALLIQNLSAKLGIATGLSLPQAIAARSGRRSRVALWIQAEFVAMATDLAEFIGAALGLHLLFGLPMMWAALLTALTTFAILALQGRGVRGLELVITALLFVVLAGFAVDLLLAAPEPSGVAGGLVPSLPGSEALLLATGILGATVMPHAIYLHSALATVRAHGRTESERRRLLSLTRIDILSAMVIAGLVNVAILVVAASVFHVPGLEVPGVEEAFATLGDRLGGHSDVLFGAALLASGISSSAVGTMSGQVIMDGFMRRRIPVFARRLVTMVPALVVIALGIPAAEALVASQVVLSFGIPFALIPLIRLTADRGLMGTMVNRRVTTVTACAVAAAIVALNAVLLVQLALG